MSTQKDIKKVGLLKVKDGYGLKVSFKEIDNVGSPGSDDCERRGLIHPDLKAAVDALKVHWGLLSGLIKVDDVPDIALPEHKLLEKIHVNGYSIGGDEEENTQGVMISGHYQTWRNKSQQLNTPFDRFEGSPEARYLYMDDLLAKIEVIEDEVQKYLTGEKRGKKPETPKEEKPADKAQVKMDFNQEAPVTKMQIVPPQEKVTEEGNLAPASAKHKFANKDAMARVAELETDQKPKNKGGKRVKQSADNPSGIVEDTEEKEAAE